MSVPPIPETVEVEFIAPRQLAGGGDAGWVTVPLHSACGWSYGHDPLMPHVILSSPDQKALLRLAPDPDGQWWTFQHAPEPDRPAWYASFGARTPVELIAALADALTDPAITANASADPYAPLQQVAWSPTTGESGFVSPDGTAYVQRSGSTQESGAWFITATLGPDQPLWQARFGEHTPPHLIAAFTTALADPAPVPRADRSRSLPIRPDLVTRTRRDVPAVQVAFALEERVRSLAARPSGPAASTSPLPRPPVQNGRSR